MKPRPEHWLGKVKSNLETLVNPQMSLCKRQVSCRVLAIMRVDQPGDSVHSFNQIKKKKHRNVSAQLVQRAKTKLNEEKHGLRILALRNSFYNLLVQPLAGNSNHALGLSHSTRLFLIPVTLRYSFKKEGPAQDSEDLCSPVSRFQPLFEPWNPLYSATDLEERTVGREVLWGSNFHPSFERYRVSWLHITAREPRKCPLAMCLGGRENYPMNQ